MRSSVSDRSNIDQIDPDPIRAQIHSGRPPSRAVSTATHVRGMLERNYSPLFAQQICRQIQGFGS